MMVMIFFLGSQALSVISLEPHQFKKKQNLTVVFVSLDIQYRILENYKGKEPNR